MPVKEGPVPPFPEGADPDEYDRLRRRVLWTMPSGLYVIGGAIVLLVLPFALAANLVQSGKAVGRILSIVMGIVAVPILLGVLIIKLSLTDEVTRYCQ